MCIAGIFPGQLVFLWIIVALGFRPLYFVKSTESLALLASYFRYYNYLVALILWRANQNTTETMRMQRNA